MINRVHPDWPRRYGFALLSVAFATALRLLLAPLIGDRLPFSAYVVAAMATAWYAGWAPALLSMVLGGVVASALFVPPPGFAAILDSNHLISLVSYLFVGSISVVLSESLRRSRERAEASAGEAVEQQRVLEQEIEQRRQAEEANVRLYDELKRSEQRLDSLIASVPGIVWEAWGEPDAAAQRINFVSDYVQQMLGYTTEEWVSTPNFWLEIVHPDDRERAAKRAAATFESPDPGINQFRWIARDGRVVWALTYSRAIRDESGKPTGMRGVTLDVTPQMQTEEALREQTQALETIHRIGQTLAAELDLEKLLQAVTDAATDVSGARFGSFFHNVVDERGESYLLYTLSGVPREAFSGFPMPRNTAIFAPTFRGEGAVRLDDVTQDPRFGQNAPYDGMPEGHLPVLSYMAVPVVSRSGEVLGGLFFGHPEPGVFTEQAERIVTGIAAQAAVAIDNARLYEQARAAQEALRQRAEALQEADQQKDAFLAMLGHELRTPLGALRNTLLLMERRTAGRSDLEPLYGRLDRQVERMARIIDDLQDLSRIARGRLSMHRETLDLVELVRQTAEDQRGMLEAAGQTLELALPPSPIGVEGDAVRLGQVLMNLLGNASKFTDAGGKVTVCLGANGDGVTVTVQDTGIGIEPEMLSRIFDSFTQAEVSLDRTRGGLGLGLALVKGLVELHGGEVYAASQGPGHGAAIGFCIPVVASGTALPPAEPTGIAGA